LRAFAAGGCGPLGLYKADFCRKAVPQPRERLRAADVCDVAFTAKHNYKRLPPADRCAADLAVKGTLHGRQLHDN